jgi:hypothetical protein
MKCKSWVLPRTFHSERFLGLFFLPFLLCLFGLLGLLVGGLLLLLRRWLVGRGRVCNARIAESSSSLAVNMAALNTLESRLIDMVVSADAAICNARVAASSSSSVGMADASASRRVWWSSRQLFAASKILFKTKMKTYRLWSSSPWTRERKALDKRLSLCKHNKHSPPQDCAVGSG